MRWRGPFACFFASAACANTIAAPTAAANPGCTRRRCCTVPYLSPTERAASRILPVRRSTFRKARFSSACARVKGLAIALRCQAISYLSSPSPPPRGRVELSGAEQGEGWSTTAPSFSALRRRRGEGDRSPQSEWWRGRHAFSPSPLQRGRGWGEGAVSIPTLLPCICRGGGPLAVEGPPYSPLPLCGRGTESAQPAWGAGEHCKPAAQQWEGEGAVSIPTLLPCICRGGGSLAVEGPSRE